MKKAKKSATLQLSVEAIKLLSATSLRDVVGGSDQTCCDMGTCRSKVRTFFG